MNKQQNKQKLWRTHIYINISCKCDINRAGHFTLDAYASRPVACGYLGYMPYFTGTNVTIFHWNWIVIGICNGLVLTVMSISTDDLVLTRFFLFRFCCSCWSVKCYVMYQTPRCQVLIASPHQHAYSHYREARFVWHDDVIKWKHFPRNWPFVRGIHRSRWIPRTKASEAELWCFLWSASE